MKLYLAIDSSSGEVKAFLDEDDLLAFVKENEYGFDYVELDGLAFPISTYDMIVHNRVNTH